MQNDNLVNERRVLKERAVKEVNELVDGKYRIIQISIIGSVGRGYNHEQSDLDATAIYVLNKRQLCSLKPHPKHITNSDGSVRALEITHWMNQLVDYKPTAIELLIHGFTAEHTGFTNSIRGTVWEYLDKVRVADAFATMSRGMMYHPKINFKDMVRAMYFYILAKFIHVNPMVLPPYEVSLLLSVRGLIPHREKFMKVFKLYSEGTESSSDIQILNKIWGCEDFVKEVFIPLCEELMVGKDYVTDNEQLVNYLEMYLRVYVYKIS